MIYDDIIDTILPYCPGGIFERIFAGKMILDIGILVINYNFDRITHFPKVLY